jgi:hypothetical protein
VLQYRSDLTCWLHEEELQAAGRPALARLLQQMKRLGRQLEALG